MKLTVGFKEIIAALQVGHRVCWVLKLTQRGSPSKCKHVWRKWQLVLEAPVNWFSSRDPRAPYKNKTCVSSRDGRILPHVVEPVSQPDPGRAQAARLNQIRISFSPKWVKTHFQPYVWNVKCSFVRLKPISERLCAAAHLPRGSAALLGISSSKPSGLLSQASASKATYFSKCPFVWCPISL